MSEDRVPLAAGAAIIRLTTAVGERALEARASSGLSALQLQVLRIAAVGTNMTVLAAALGASKSTVTSVVDQLEAMNLAVRAGDEDDGRRRIVQSTPEGAGQLRAFDVALARRIDDLLANLSSARSRRLRELMTRLPDATVPIPLAGSD
jgi:DNA-binding MarR family transcriptional regulator